MVANLYGPFKGRRHDSALLAASNLVEKCEQLPVSATGERYYVYGDLGYPLRRYLIVPYKEENLTEAEQSFNSRMSKVRESVEWGFNKVIQLFAFLDFKKNLKMGLQPVGKYYIVGTILSNCHTCLYGSQTADYFNLLPPRLEEYLNEN